MTPITVGGYQASSGPSGLTIIFILAVVGGVGYTAYRFKDRLPIVGSNAGAVVRPHLRALCGVCVRACVRAVALRGLKGERSYFCGEGMI